MRKLLVWLHEEPFGWQTIRLILSLLIVNYLYLTLAIALFYPLGLLPVDSAEDKQILDILLTSFPIVLIIAAAFEEIIFRVIPLSLVMTLENDYLTVITAIIVSLFFGWLHGGVINIFLQGFAGLLMSFCFLKCGGMVGNYTKAFLASTTLHSLNNMLALALYLLFSVPL